MHQTLDFLPRTHQIYKHDATVCPSTFPYMLCSAIRNYRECCIKSLTRGNLDFLGQAGNGSLDSLIANSNEVRMREITGLELGSVTLDVGRTRTRTIN